MSGDLDIVFEGYSKTELAANLFAAARRLMMTEDGETYSAARALNAVRKDAFRLNEKLDAMVDEALDEALHLVSKLGKLSSMEVLVAGEAIMTERAYR